MARWKDKVHRTSKSKVQSTGQVRALMCHCKASTQELRTDAGAGNVQGRLVEGGKFKSTFGRR